MNLMEHELLKIWLDFISKLIASLVWPLAIVFVLVFLRKPLRELIPLLKKLKLQGVEMEFSEQLKEIKQELQKYILPAPEAALTKKEYESKILDRILVSRAGAITEAWEEVEDAAVEAARRKGVPDSLISLGRIESKLKEVGVFDEWKARVYDRLRKLRNLAVHEGDKAISDSDALAFADLAIQLAEHLRSS